MRYLRPVRIHESNKSDRKTLNKVKRYHAEFDAAKSGEPGAAQRARAAKARLRANIYGNDTAKVPFYKNTAIDLGKQQAEKAKRLENSSITPLTLPSIMEGKYKDQREAGKVRGPIAQAAMNKLRGSKGKMVRGKLKPATSKAARESYKRAARAAAGTSKPVKPPEDRLPEPRGGMAGSRESEMRRKGDEQ